MSQEHDATTEAMEADDESVPPGGQPYIARPIRKPLSVAHLLENHLDWLQHDLNAVGEDLCTFQTRTGVALAAMQEQLRYTWFALVCVALLLLVNALLMGWVIYLMGTVIGHVR